MEETRICRKMRKVCEGDQPGLPMNEDGVDCLALGACYLGVSKKHPQLLLQSRQ
jgi:hypothetical protein